MSVLSLQFMLFLLVLLICYYGIPVKYRWIVLLLGSYGFYLAGNWKCVFLILLTTIQTFFAAGGLNRLNCAIKELKQVEDRELRKVQKNKLVARKKGIVAITLVINFSLLFFFKTTYLWREIPILLPLGISFYTFQSVGYLIDVYRGHAEAEKNIFRYALFVSYFPQIIQGPINRYKQLAPQLYNGTVFDLQKIKMGLWLFLWGMFKKLVISDRVSVFVNTVLGSNLQETPGSIILLGVFAFNIQLYTDFSGGIDMVQGVSAMFGIEMAENFRRPFFSRTLAEYWRRWHISLGTWIKDYVFYPIAMSKAFGKFGKAAKEKFGNHIGKTLPGAVTSVITFVLIGLWHDVTLQYLLYGLWHGIILGASTVCEPLFQMLNIRMKIKTGCMSFRWFQRGRTWMLISIGEYFSLAESMEKLKAMFLRTLFHFDYSALIIALPDYSLDYKDWWVINWSLLILILVSIKQESGVQIRRALERQNVLFRGVLITGLISVIMIFGVYGTGYQAGNFIYGGF